MKTTLSAFDRLNVATVLTITPEYGHIKKLQGPGFGKTPTFAKPYPMPMEFKTIAGVKIRMARSPKENAPTVILMNPLPQSIMAFAPIWEKLAAEFNLYAYDLPGFGRSEGGLEFMTFKAQGQFLDNFIKEHDIKQPHLIGPDVGMSAALHYATNFENDIASLVIGDGPGIAPSSNGSVISKIVDSGFWRLIFTVTDAGAFVGAGNKICYVNYVPNDEEVADYLMSYEGRIGTITKWFKDYPASLATVDPKLEQIKAPTLIFWGKDDALLLPDNAERLHKRIKRSKLNIFENCGHYSYQDKHEEFAQMALDWVNGGYSEV
jgi:pimeloyl-ACP methyl ester carboxylesterase